MLTAAHPIYPIARTLTFNGIYRRVQAGPEACTYHADILVSISSNISG
jgi:hypothetical protein